MLPGLTANAENIPYTDEDINRLGANRFKMLNGIGVHTFNFTEQSDYLVSEGYIIMANTYDYSVSVNLDVVLKLSIVDLDDEGNARTHKVTNGIYYYPVPKDSWIQLEETDFTINSLSEYKVKYKISIPTGKAYKAIHKNNSHGLLCYVNIKTGEECFVNVNYNYKCFMAFEGEYKEKTAFDSPFTIFILINIIFISILICIAVIKIIKKRKVKKGAIVEAEN